MKRLRTLAVLLTLVSLASLSTMMAQPNFEIPLTVTDGNNTYTLYMGIFPGAHFGVDPGDVFGTHAEYELPPIPPAGVFDARFSYPRTGVDPGPPAGFGQGTPYDYRPFLSLAQADTFRTKNQVGTGAGIVVSWSSSEFASRFVAARMVDAATGGLLVSVDMLAVNTVDLGAAGQSDFKIFTTGLQAPVTPGPCFSLSAWPTGVNANVGGFTDVVVNASNGGAVNDLNVTDATSDNPVFTIVSPPVPFVVPHAGSVPVTIRFSPTASGAQAGNITFTHDPLNPDCGGNTTTILAVNGTAISNALLFTADSRTHNEDLMTYQDNLRLAYQGPGALKAVQVRLVMQGNGTTGLILQSVTRGADLPAGQFNFATQIHYGTAANGDGTTNDTMSIVVYGNGNYVIPPGADLTDFIHFRYGVGHATPNGDQVVHIQLLDVYGSLPNGDAVTISADDPQIINIQQRGVGGFQYGDVNHDNSVDIVDLLLVVDYILGRNPSPFYFENGDLAPWTSGAPAPTPDGVINVQDLSLLQQIILTGQYPDGLPLYAPVVPPIVNNGSGLAKGNSNVDVKLVFYMSEQGIAVRMENAVKVKGIQLEFNNAFNVPSTMRVTTLLGDGPFFGENGTLRVLMYNREARTVNPGTYLVGNMPFALANPGNVEVTKVIVVGENNNKIEPLDIQINTGNPPELPVDYLLSQNYPNPFNPTTKIKFAIPQAGNVKIAVYDLLGQEVRTLYESYMDRGTNFVTWDGLDNNGNMASSGMYIYRMTSGSFVQSLKMMFMK